MYFKLLIDNEKYIHLFIHKFVYKYLIFIYKFDLTFRNNFHNYYVLEVRLSIINARSCKK